MDEVRVPRALVAFLNGEAPLEGRWFGDRENGVPAYWWRTHLNAAIAAAPQQPAAQPVEDSELSAALGWPGGVSAPILDRKTLLTMVAEMRQQQPAAQPQCAMRHAPVWKAGANGLPYQESNFQCEVCGYRGTHDAHPGCKRPEPASAEPVAWLVRNRPLSTPVLELDAARAKGAEADGYHVIPLHTHHVDAAEVLRLFDKATEAAKVIGYASDGGTMQKGALAALDKARAALCRALGVKS